MTRSPRRPARAPLGALVAAVLVLVAACSGQTSSFSGGGSGGGDNAGSGGNAKSISMSVVAGWDEDVAATYMWKELLEEHGYKVNVQELDIASTFTGVANGQIDTYLDAWLPVTHETYYKRFQKQLEIVSTWSKGENLLAVPNYVNVNSIADLKANSAEFGNRIVGIEAGAGLMRATRTKVIPEYGLKNYNLVEGSSPAMLASLDAAIKQKQPIVVTLWQPHWAFSRFPIKVLKDTDGAFGKPDDIQIIATKGFTSKHAEVAGWLKNFKMSSADLSNLMLKLRAAGQGHEQEAAKAWIAQNKKVVDPWFNGTTAAG